MDYERAEILIGNLDSLAKLYLEHIELLRHDLSSNYELHLNEREALISCIADGVNWINGVKAEKDDFFYNLKIESLEKLRLIKGLSLDLEETALKKKADISRQRGAISRGKRAINRYGANCRSSMNRGVGDAPFVMSITS